MSDKQIVPSQQNTALTRIQAAGQAANEAAAKNAFRAYRSRKSERTAAIQKTNLGHFTEFLLSVGAFTEDEDRNLFDVVEDWHGVTYGLIEAFRVWMLENSYSIASVNLALSNVKVYAKMAFRAGIIPEGEHALIRTITGYSRKDGKELDKHRIKEDVATRHETAKKAESNTLGIPEARMLKKEHDLSTPQGRRDALMMAMLIDFGLRCSEVADLKVKNVNLSEKTLTFYRRKVDRTQTFELSGDNWKAVKAWFDSGDAPIASDAPLLRASRKGGNLTAAGMTERAITGRVKALGLKLLGIKNLSAHDCRHTGATIYSRKGVDAFQLRDWGGWNSLAMPSHYVEAAAIANEGMGSI